MREVWKDAPGVREFVGGCYLIDETLGNTVVAALRAGYTLDQVQSLCKIGLTPKEPTP